MIQSVRRKLVKNNMLNSSLNREIDEGLILPATIGGANLALINITLPDGNVNEYACLLYTSDAADE